MIIINSILLKIINEYMLIFLRKNNINIYIKYLNKVSKTKYIKT